MISAAALDDLRRFADAGRIGAGMIALNLSADNLQPIIGATITLRWHLGGADVGMLSIPGLGRFAVPAEGQRRIQVGADELYIELQADEQSANLVIAPKPIIPRVINFGAVGRRAVLGQQISINWEVADAENVVLCIQDGNRLSQYDVAAQGSVRVTPHNLGNLLVSITARSRHAAVAEQANISVERRIPVVAPPVKIKVEQQDQSGYLGDEVRFSWTITGATRAQLIAIDRNQQFDVPLIGGMDVEVTGIDSERFRLMAVGADGVEHAAKLSVTPKLLDIGRYPQELSYLTTINWE